MTIKLRYNQNVASVKVPICDACFMGHHTACEGKNCECQWTHNWKEKQKDE